MTGLTFTPDGSRLRASVYHQSAIVEFDSAGTMSVALGPGDGIAGPLGGNNIAYDREEKFYVAGGRRIMRYPAEGGPGEVYGDISDGVRGDGPIALGPNGDLFYGLAGLVTFREIFRFTGPGQSEVFDTLPQNTSLGSLAVDAAGNVFAATSGGTYRYDAGDPARRTWISPAGAAGGPSSMTYSTYEDALYIASSNRITRIDPHSGETELLVTLPVDTEYEDSGYGVAIAIPEPATASLVALVVLLTRCSRRIQFPFHIKGASK
ncbi:MAG: hypothetical protein IT450_19620 [Phycisphaerales bacterium]|nr:hypothetical protein [Phycisphaerales bacterium]